MGVRKKVRHCSKRGHRAEHIQVAYFSYTDRGRGKRRRSRYQETTPKQKRLNDKKSRRYFEALVQSNFGDGDLHITPTYDDEHVPVDEADAKRQFTNFIARINYHRRKRGLPKAKWVAVTEFGKKNGRPHHHIVMDAGLSRDEVEALWHAGYCNADRIRPDKRKGMRQLIAYLSKDPKGNRRWNSSHGNLVKPWVSINDSPKMSKKRLRAMSDLPEDCEQMRQIIECDNPGYELIDVEKDFREDIAQWYFFARLKLKNPQNPQEKASSGG